MGTALGSKDTKRQWYNILKVFYCYFLFSLGKPKNKKSADDADNAD